MMALALDAMHIPISDHLSLMWHELSTKNAVCSLASRSRTGMLRLSGSIPLLNCVGGNTVGITWERLLAGVGAARRGVCSSGIVSPTVDELAGTGWVGTGGNSRARTSMGRDGSHLHRAWMAPYSISRRLSEWERTRSRSVSALLLSPDENGNGVGALSIGSNPPMIIWVGVDEDMFDKKITFDDETNKVGKVEGMMNFLGLLGERTGCLVSLKSVGACKCL